TLMHSRQMWWIRFVPVELYFSKKELPDERLNFFETRILTFRLRIRAGRLAGRGRPCANFDRLRRGSPPRAPPHPKKGGDSMPCSLAEDVLAQTSTGSAGIPTRVLGRTKERVSILCLGGWHIGAVKEKTEAIQIMHAAIDEGINFFDNAWAYHH